MREWLLHKETGRECCPKEEEGEESREKTRVWMRKKWAREMADSATKMNG
jgi:hypothetical protein